MSETNINTADTQNKTSSWWLIIASSTTWLPFSVALLIENLLHYGADTVFEYWMTWYIFIPLLIGAPLAILSLVFYLTRRFQSKGARKVMFVLTCIGAIGNVVYGLVQFFFVAKQVIGATNTLLLQDGLGLLQLLMVLVASLGFLAGAWLYNQEKQRVATAHKYSKAFFWSSALLLFFSLGWSLFVHLWIGRVDAQWEERERLKDMALPVISICGNGVCEINCRKETWEQGGCVSENTGNCPQDCQTICVWKKNSRQMPWEKQLGDYLCTIATAQRGSLQPLQEYYYTPDYVPCQAQEDCPSKHVCAFVDRTQDLGTDTGKPDPIKICVVNPVR